MQADDANINPSPWVKDMFAAVPNLGNIAAGWTVHPYGPRTEWEPRISRLIQQTAAVGSPNLPIFMTEWGISTDNGRQLDDNYDWPTGMSYADAGAAVTREIDAMNARFPGRLGDPAVVLHPRPRRARCQQRPRGLLRGRQGGPLRQGRPHRRHPRRGGQVPRPLGERGGTGR